MAAGRGASDVTTVTELAGVRSVVRWSDGQTTEDTNGFVTALAVRDLRRSGRSVPARWLDTLESCRRPDGSYGFWPQDAVPSWAPRLPPDSDDTAVMLLELTIAGRVPRARARSVACHRLGAHRLRRVLEPGPPWLRRGMFTTWHRDGRDVDLVDLTAVTNVLSVLHALDLATIPGVEESSDALSAAVQWAGGDAVRWASTSPFYPEPEELARALEHAAEWSVPGSAEAARAIRVACPRQSPDVVCSAPYGPPTWHSPELADLRGSAGHVEVDTQGVVSDTHP
jgi:hypothetical protein